MSSNLFHYMKVPYMLSPEIVSSYECGLLCLFWKKVLKKNKVWNAWGQNCSIENSEYQIFKIVSKEFVQWIVKWNVFLLMNILANTEYDFIIHLMFISFWKGIVLHIINQHLYIFKAKTYGYTTNRNMAMSKPTFYMHFTVP